VLLCEEKNMTLYQMATQPTQTLVGSLGQCLLNLSPAVRRSPSSFSLLISAGFEVHNAALSKAEVIPTERLLLPERIQGATVLQPIDKNCGQEASENTTINLP